MNILQKEAMTGGRMEIRNDSTSITKKIGGQGYMTTIEELGGKKDKHLSDQYFIETMCISTRDDRNLSKINKGHIVSY